jgi:hypothetical protein
MAAVTSKDCRRWEFNRSATQNRVTAMPPKDTIATSSPLASRHEASPEARNSIATGALEDRSRARSHAANPPRSSTSEAAAMASQAVETVRMLSAARPCRRTTSEASHGDGESASRRGCALFTVPGQTRPKINEPLVPPKPNELDSAARIVIWRAVFGT